MDNPTIWLRLRVVFQDVFDDPDIEIKPETTTADIEDWDSLTHIQLLVAVEREFGIRFNTGEVAGLQNVDEMANLIALRTDCNGP